MGLRSIAWEPVHPTMFKMAKKKKANKKLWMFVDQKQNDRKLQTFKNMEWWLFLGVIFNTYCIIINLCSANRWGSSSSCSSAVGLRGLIEPWAEVSEAQVGMISLPLSSLAFLLPISHLFPTTLLPHLFSCRCPRLLAPAVVISPSPITSSNARSLSSLQNGLFPQHRRLLPSFEPLLLLCQQVKAPVLKGWTGFVAILVFVAGLHWSKMHLTFSVFKNNQTRTKYNLKGNLKFKRNIFLLWLC